MRRWVLVSLGLLLAVAGLLFALLNTGVYYLADCSAQCEADGERALAGALAIGGYVACVAGLALALVARRPRRARPS